MTGHPFFGLGLALFGALVLTPDALLMRLSGMEGIQMMGWRGVFMGGAMTCAWALTARDRRADVTAAATGLGAGVALCQLANSALFCFGIATAPAAVVLFGVAAVPVFSALLSWAFFGERAGLATWVTIAAVLAGIAVAVSGGHGGAVRLDLASVIGALCGLGVAMALAVNFVILRARPGLPILLLIGSGALMAGATGFAVMGPGAMWDGRIWAMAITGMVVLPVSFFSLSLAARYTAAANVSLIMLLETVLGPLWVWLALGEAASPAMLAGGAIVIVSLAIYLLRERSRTRRARAIPR